MLCKALASNSGYKGKGGKDRKKVKIAWEIYQTGELKITSREGDKLTFLGDVKKPIAIGKKKDLWANLDEEFYSILDLWRWHRAGLIDINHLPYEIAIGIRYLVEVDLAESKGIINAFK